jgi:hypothetical protein
MSPASSDASMLAVADPAPLRPTLVAVDSCTRQHANLLVPRQIVSGLVTNPWRRKTLRTWTKMLNLAGQGASSKSWRNWRQGSTCWRENPLEDSGSITSKGGHKMGQNGLKSAGLTHFWVHVTPVFPKKTKCKPICMLGSSFMHIVTYKWMQKQYHVRKSKIIRDLRLNPGNEGSNITGSRLGVAYS